jgi:4a-hydroxytetrahydrobiopterin dehydratase
MNEIEIADLMETLEAEWSREGACIVRTYRFKDYHETMAFVNAVAWIAHRADHHPDLQVGYNRCKVTYTTHSAGGLSRKDFECAASVEALFMD